MEKFIAQQSLNQMPGSLHDGEYSADTNVRQKTSSQSKPNLNPGSVYSAYNGAGGDEPGLSTLNPALLNADLNPAMFMQARNFDQQRSSPMQPDLYDQFQPDVHEIPDAVCESALDLLEQQQTMEQARLLHRFKELRHLQSQQQETLMMQQQQQLGMLREEQQRMQDAIVKQHAHQWGGKGHQVSQAKQTSRTSHATTSDIATQEFVNGVRSRAASRSNIMRHDEGEEVISGLPQPVFYDPLPCANNDEDKYTNPELFSNPGSIGDGQASLEDWTRQKAEPVTSVPADTYAIRAHPVPEEGRGLKVTRNVAVRSIDVDEGIGTQSFQSSSAMEQQREVPGMATESQDEADNSMERPNEDQVDAAHSPINHDEMPVVPGIVGKKTFEELLEEQLQQEEAASRVIDNENSATKKPFLKRGAGLTRFGGLTTNKSKSKLTKKPDTDLKPTKQVTKSTSRNKLPDAAPKQATTSETKQYAAPKKLGPQSKPGPLYNAAMQRLTLVPSPGKIKDKSQVVGACTVSATANVDLDSVTDTSFTENIQKRELTAKMEEDELDDFELLEEFADNMSFASNSSLVIRVLKNERLTRPPFPSNISQKAEHPVQQQKSAPAQSIKGAEQTVESSSKEENRDDTLVDSDSSDSDSDTSDTESSIDSQLDDDDTDGQSDYDDASDNESGDNMSTVQTEMQRLRHAIEKVTIGKHDSGSNAAGIEPQSPSKVLTRKVFRTEKSPLKQEPVIKSLLDRLTGNSEKITNGASMSGPSPVSVSKVTISRTSPNNSSALQSKRTGYHRSHGVDDSQSNESDSEQEKHSQNNYKLQNVGPMHNGYADNKNFSNNGEFLQTENKNDVSDNEDENGFDDDEEWGDISYGRHGNTPSDASDTPTAKQMLKVKANQNEDAKPSPPPTSKLVSRLFPKLRDEQAMLKLQRDAEQEKKLQISKQVSVGDGIQSKILRDKLMELETEIERFRKENSNLEKLRKEREEGVEKLKKEIADFQKEKDDELKRLQDFKNQEMKKLRHEKKVFEQYQKAARAMPDKKEREEMDALRNQVNDLQEELKRKESRWTSSTARMRARVDQLEQESSELKEEVRMLERKRLEWLQKEQASKQQQTPAAPKSSTPTHEGRSKTVRKDYIPVVNHSAEGPCYKEKSPRRSNSAAQRSEKGIHKSTSKSATNSESNCASLRSDKGIHKSTSKSATNGDRGNPLRISLTEEAPRHDLAIMVPQDVSIYTDNESEAAFPIEKNLPRKKAVKFNVDKSAIDKGNDEYDEVMHSDGKIERIYKNGAREILFSNGTRKEISSSGQSIVVSFFNGDIKQIMSDQRVMYYYGDAQTTHTTYPDGLEILQFPNNQIEKHYPDGTKEITFPDQTIKYLFTNGSEESVFPDGTVIRVDKNGDKTMEFPSGQREIHTQQFKKREYPDGTVKTVYPNGRQETRYSNGRIRVKDKDGNIVMDNRH